MIQARHLPADRGAVPARPGAFLHVAQRLAIGGAGIANIGAEGAKLGVELAFTGQKIGGGGADLGAVQHQAQMLGPRMFAADLQAMSHRHPQTGLVTVLQLVHAVLDLGTVGMHGALRIGTLGKRVRAAGRSPRLAAERKAKSPGRGGLCPQLHGRERVAL